MGNRIICPKCMGESGAVRWCIECGESHCTDCRESDRIMRVLIGKGG